MGIFSNIFSKKIATTKMKVAGLAASTVDFVVQDAGLKMLLNGSLILSKDFGVSFKNGKATIGNEVIAAISISDLDHSDDLRKFAELDIRDTFLLQPIVDRLIYEVIDKFSQQCTDFAALETGIIGL